MEPRERQLGAVLRQRRLAEEERQRVVMTLESQRAGLEARAAAHARSFNAIRTDLRDALAPGDDQRRVAVADIRTQAGATLHAQVALRALAIETAGVHRRLDSARADLAAAAAARQAVELLLDRLEAQRRTRAERREAVELDEISTARAARADHPGMEPPL